MKQILLLFLSITTLVSYAQSPSPLPLQITTSFNVNYGENDARKKGETILFEPDNYSVNSANITGVWGAGSAEDKARYKVIENPSKGGVNSSDKCLEVTCQNNDGSIGITFNDLFGGYKPNFNGRRRISMLFKAGENNGTPIGNGYYTQLQLETNYSPDGKQVYYLGAYYDATNTGEGGHDGWKRLYFDFSPYNIPDNNAEEGYHPYAIGDYPDVLVFKPMICTATIAADGRTITDHHSATCSAGDVYYIDDIKIEDVPYAEGYWIEDLVNLPKGTFDASATPKWNTEACALPQSGTDGVLHLSGTWLKGENLVNPEIWEGGVTGSPWVYEFNEYRDLSWHVKPDQVKLMVFHEDSKLRWGDRGGLMGTNTAADVEAGYPERFIDNLNVLIFAEKSSILPDEVDNLEAVWHDVNAVIHYTGDDSWKAWELELTDNYSFLNPKTFTVENLIKVHRSMITGYNALIYPFALTPEELSCSRVGTLYHHKDESKIYFVPAEHTEANVPYIIENFTPVVVEGEKNVTGIYQEFKGSRPVSAVDEDFDYISEAEGATFHGTYKRISGQGKWGLTGGTTFKQGGTNSSFKPFRAYLTFEDPNAAAMFSSFSIEPMEITGISMVNNDCKGSGSEYVYDLYGRRYRRADLLNGTLPRQIYIVDGKKVAIK